jgi:hypothetical protein
MQRSNLELLLEMMTRKLRSKANNWIKYTENEEIRVKNLA